MRESTPRKQKQRASKPRKKPLMEGELHQWAGHWSPLKMLEASIKLDRWVPQLRASARSLTAAEIDPELQLLAAEWDSEKRLEIAGTLERWSQQLRDTARIALPGIGHKLSPADVGYCEKLLQKHAKKMTAERVVALAHVYERWAQQLRAAARAKIGWYDDNLPGLN